jgi:surfactin synthase thioesterase subunit
MDELCDALIQALVPHCDRPFAFFGHSMGALISFALTRRLRQRGLPLPAQLFLSAYRAPQIPLEASWHLLPDDELVQKILTLNGTRGEVFANPELRRMLLPIFRADLTLCDTYPYTPEEPLNVPFTIFGGQEDKRAEQKTLEAWRKHTSADFTLHMFPGDHFFWHSNAQPVWQIITQALLASSTVHV